MKKKLPKAQKLPSGTWRCQVMVDGKRVSVVAETPGEAQAKAVALKAGLIEKAKKSTPLLLVKPLTATSRAKMRCCRRLRLQGISVSGQTPCKRTFVKGDFTQTMKSPNKLEIASIPNAE